MSTPSCPLLLTGASLLLAIMSPARAEVTFDFDYSDPSTSMLSPAAKSALTTAGQNVASYFVNYSANVTISITAYNDPISPIWADAGANYDVGAIVPGFDNPGGVGKKIRSNGALDENGAAADGFININMGDWYNYAGDNDPGMADFTSLIMHELGHSLGLFGIISESGAPFLDGYFVPYAQFLTNSAGEKMVTFNSGSGLWEVNVPLWTAAGTGGTGSGLYFDGTSAMEANGKQLVPLHSPETWAEGSSMNHPDPNIFPGMVMNPYPHFGTGPHAYTDIEIGMLRDIGYTNIVPEPGGGLLALLGLGLGVAARRQRKPLRSR